MRSIYKATEYLGFLECGKAHPPYPDWDGLGTSECKACVIDRLQDNIESYFKPAAEAVLKAVREIEFKRGRNLGDPFDGNNLPANASNSETITLRRDRLEKFRDDFSLMAAWLAWHFKTDHVAPIHLVGPLMERLRP